MNNLVLAALTVLFAYMLVSRFLAARSRISGVEARTLVDGGALLLDVRTPAEYSTGHLPGALNVPLGDLPRRVEKLAKDKPVVVYCRSGARSASARRFLERAGFTAHDLGPQHAWPR